MLKDSIGIMNENMKIIVDRTSAQDEDIVVDAQYEFQQKKAEFIIINSLIDYIKKYKVDHEPDGCDIEVKMTWY